MLFRKIIIRVLLGCSLWTWDECWISLVYPFRFILTIFHPGLCTGRLICIGYINRILDHPVSIWQEIWGKKKSEVTLIISLALSNEVKLSGLHTSIKLTERVLSLKFRVFIMIHFLSSAISNDPKGVSLYNFSRT